jgi:hypothetical protein
MAEDDSGGPRRGILQRAPRWARPLIVILLIALVIGSGYLRTADPLEDSEFANGPIVPLLVIALGLASIFWGATKVNETERARMSQGLTWDRLLAKLPAPAIRAFLVIAGLAITALGIAALFDPPSPR